jgi:ribosomal protein L34E
VFKARIIQKQTADILVDCARTQGELVGLSTAAREVQVRNEKASKKEDNRLYLVCRSTRVCQHHNGRAHKKSITHSSNRSGRVLGPLGG